MSTIPLPTGWRLARIGDAFDVWGGHTPSKANPAYWGEGLPWFSSQDIKTRRLSTSTHSVTRKALDETGLRVCPAGSVLVVVRSGILAHTLPVGVTTRDAAINQDLKAFYSKEPLLNEWLALFLRAKGQELLASSRRDGTTVQSLQMPLLVDTMIPIPPDRTLRDLFALLDAADQLQSVATQRIATAREALRQLRRAVLAAACAGRLTDEWRQTNPRTAPASAIVQARETRLKRPKAQPQPLRPGPSAGLPPNWCWTSIGSLVDVATGATPLRSRADYYGGVTPWVTSGAVNADVITKADEAITDVALKETNAKVFAAGTLLVAMYGEGQTRGKVAELGIAAATNQAVAALLFDDHSADLRPYLRLFLLENYERMRQVAFGGVQPNLSLGAIRDTPVPLPPAAEQAEILRRVDQLLELASAIQVKLASAEAALGQIAQAILGKAFRGELSATMRS